MIERLLPVLETPAHAKRPLIYRHYDELLRAAAERNQKAFDYYLDVVVREYRARAKSRLAPDEWYWGWGKLGEAMSLDLQGIAICKLACKLGLHVGIDDPQYPQALIAHWA